MMPANLKKIEPLCFDIFVICAAFIYLTGGSFLMNDSLRLLVNQKPWIHRVFLTAIAVSALAWHFFRLHKMRVDEAPSGFIHRALSKIQASSGGLTWAMFFIASAIWGISASIRHGVFQTSFDMAIFTQAIWNTSQGDWFYSSIKGGVNLMSDHFSPVLALIAVPYRFLPSPHLILWIQTLAAASCFFPLAALAKKHLSDPKLFFTILLAFFFYLPVRNSVRFDFHPEVLAMPLFLWAIYFLETKKLLISSIFILFALSTKEGAGIVAAAIGFYSLLRYKAKAYGFFWMFSGVIYFAFITQWVIPHIFKADYFYLASNYLSWKDHGGLPAFVAHIANASTLSYLIKVFAPLCFFGFLDISILLTFPALAQNLLARNEMARSIFFQYTAYLTPFVFISTIHGLSKIKNQKNAAVLLLFTTVLMGGVSELYVIEVAAKKLSPRNASIQSHMRAIPSNESVRTHEFFASHLANRKNLHIYENQHPKEGGSQAALNSTYLVVGRQLLGDNYASALKDIVANGYTAVLEDNGFYIFKKTASL